MKMPPHPVRQHQPGAGRNIEQPLCGPTEIFTAAQRVSLPAAERRACSFWRRNLDRGSPARRTEVNRPGSTIPGPLPPPPRPGTREAWPRDDRGPGEVSPTGPFQRNRWRTESASERKSRLVIQWLATHPPFREALAAGFMAVAGACLVRGCRLLVLGLRQPDYPDQSARVVRGVRLGIVAIGLLFLAGGFHWAAEWPFIFSAVFLGEELFETGIMLLALRVQLGNTPKGRTLPR